MEQGNRKAQYLIAAAVSLSTATIGVSSGWPTPVIPKLHNNQTSMHFNEQQISWMVALNTPGFVIGSLATSYISDTYGRRSTLLSSALPIAIGTMIVAFFMEAWLLSVTRLMWGLGTGMISTVVNIYMAEITDKDIRARLTVMTKFMFNFGNLLVIVIGYYVSYNTLNYMMLVLPICYASACWFTPETPYYYLKEGKVADAKRVLSKLRKYKNDKELEDALTLMQQDVKNEMRRSSSFKELIVGKQYRKAVIISIGLRIGMVMTGQITTRNYLGRIMQESKSKISLETVFIIFGAVNFLVGVMSSILVDRVGRRPLLVYSFLGTGLSLALTVGYFFCQEILRIDEQYLSPYGVIPFIGIVLSTIISGLGYNSIIFTIGAEIFPLNVKSIAMTSLSVLNGILGFGVAKGYQEIKNVSGLFGVFFIFTTVAFASAIFSYYVVPETKGKSLKEIQIILQGDMYTEDEKLNHVVTENINEEEPGEMTELKVFEKKE
ncbi:facilitated trehalose transporter Tret1-like [Galleria mellonella]|uniref:Facilitated trehalose transporter Tret1-like n=1 Tax=Galleria mellonella TaxID=7137 RepID=A0ABM3N7D3_GALME|nr:facilitated trehalose transporter Tret1-like [Galleria mellonella]XP_052759498.1 facilitated trehalose transporter Tret1-like [Galleria mellonella]